MRDQLAALSSAFAKLQTDLAVAATTVEATYSSDTFSQSLISVLGWLAEKEKMGVLTSVIPRDLEQLERDSEALKALFAELERNSERVEELVEMDNRGCSDVNTIKQVCTLTQAGII